MSTDNRLAKLEQFFKEVANLTVGHEVIADTVVVYPAALGESLSRVDPDWYHNTATTAKIIAIGDSAGIILSKETPARLNVREGDTLYIAEGSQDIRLLPFASQMEAAREVIRENQDVLRKLAE
jgi:putative addiction module antidote